MYVVWQCLLQATLLKFKNFHQSKGIIILHLSIKIPKIKLVKYFFYNVYFSLGSSLGISKTQFAQQIIKSMQSILLDIQIEIVIE